MKEIEIKNDKGDYMDLASSLGTYLANRNKRNFCAGDWLKSLSDTELEKIQSLKEAALIGSSDSLQHLLFIAVMIISAEKQTTEVKVTPELIDITAFLASIVSLERIGLIIVKSDLRYDNLAKISLEITDKGLAYSDNLVNKLMAEKKRTTFH